MRENITLPEDLKRKAKAILEGKNPSQMVRKCLLEYIKEGTNEQLPD